MPGADDRTIGADARRRIDALFSAALDLPAPDRAAFVDREAAGDEPLRRAVHRLLMAERASAPVLEAAAAKQVAALGRWLAGANDAAGSDEDGDVPADPRIGQRLGPWRLCRRIGRGGMALVYLAERADGAFGQQAAVKLLGRSVDAAEDAARLAAERQILSSLTHPHIATLIDGGTTADGLPYLVTEFVDGLPLTAHCRAHALSVEARLALFLQVADAVHHAHRKLVVHRDLKPSNVLVDAEGRARLLDFGIAKLLDPGAADGAPLTRIGHVVMTPEYAAPEQRSGGEVTTATDVYQLGLLLHELLTGSRPAADTGSASGSTVARPSRLVRQGPAPPSGPPLAPPDLARRLRGDLDLIVQTALQARPEDRYASAAALADDVRRHLDGQAIAARPESPLQTLARLVRRSPWTAGAAGLALALLVGWAGTLQFYAAELARQRDAATAQAERARRANELLLGVFRRADPLQPDAVGGRDATVWASLDAATRDVRTTLADDPATLAELLGTLARLYRVGGQSERAIELLGEALTLHRRAGPDGAAVAVVLGEIGAVELQAGRAEAARAHLDEALALIDTLPPDAAAQTVPVLLDAGHAATDAGDARAAVRHFERALTLLRTDGRPDANALVESQFGLGNGLLQLGDAARAEAAIGESVRLTEAHFGADHPRIAGPLSALANVQRRLGRPQEAAATLRRAIAVLARAYGDGYAGVLSARNNLALALGEAGDGAGQQRELEALIAHQRVALGPDHPGLADLLQNLGAMLAQAGRPTVALPALAEARRIYDTRLPASSPRPAFPRLSAALAQLDLGQPQAAARDAEEAVAILQRTLPGGHFALGIGRCLLGEAWLALGRTDDGAALVRAALPATAGTPPGQAHYAERCRRVAQALDP